MATEEYAVALVVDPNFGEDLCLLAERLAVFAISSPANVQASQEAALNPSCKHEVQVLRGLEQTPEETCAGKLRFVIENKAVWSHEPPLSVIEVYGAPLTPHLREVFESETFTKFEVMSNGFIARSRRAAIAEAANLENMARPLGLALSGGGFRASAFHLGVLKRLRELGILGKVDVLSTVSGGSITGVLWAYWNARRGDTINDEAEWNSFETGLIRFMTSGVRESIILRCFWIPFACILALMAAVAAQFWQDWSFGFAANNAVMMLAAPLLASAMAYVFWHYLAARLFERLIDREFFKGATLADLSASDSEPASGQPQLIVNATSLSSGDHLLFANRLGCGAPGRKVLRRVLPDTSGIPPPRRKRRRAQHRDKAPRVSLPLATPLARAVTASCAIPPVFAPLRIPDPQPWWESPSWWPGRFMAIDGGVNDNQGTQVLLDGYCRGAIVSDAAAALQVVPNPWSWQAFPPGRGVIFRSQDIIYERMRDLGYQRLEERYEFSECLADAGISHIAEDTGVPLLDGYTYIELWPSDDFAWDTDVRLPDIFVPPVASIRTDLDRFSHTEVSALMFHGYSLIDQSIRRNQPKWLSGTPAPLQFSSPVKEVCIDWPKLTTEQAVRYWSHLATSCFRLASYRRLGSLWKARKLERKVRQKES